MKYFIGFLMFCFVTVAMGCGPGGGGDGGGGDGGGGGGDGGGGDSSSSCPCNGNDGSTSAPWQYPEYSSPAGGPSSNSNAVVCYFYRLDNCLVCRKGLFKTQKCCTEPTTEWDDQLDGGPTPYNEYLIGMEYSHPSYRIDWHNLYPKKEDSSGYYNYYDSTATGRSTMGLHPGSTSLGCVTVKGNSCWDDIDRIIASGSMTYKSSNYDGFLYVVT